MSGPLHRQELTFGSIYALFQFLLLPQLAAIANLFLKLPVWVLQVGVFALNFLCTLVIFRRFLLAACKTALQHPLKTLGFSLLGLVLYYIGTFSVALLILILQPDYLNLNDSSISQLSQQSGIWMAVGTVLLVPVAEECVFRGLLFRGIYDRKPVLAGVLSVCLFSAVHIVGYIGIYEPVHLLLAFLQYLPAGLCLNFAYKKADTIIAPILMHTCINLIGMSIM